MYTVQRITKKNKFYGPIHASLDGDDTMCGQEINENWYILSPGIRKVTCKKCIKLLNGDLKMTKKNIQNIHSEISYTNSKGKPVHSDICPPECSYERITDNYREFLHRSLDEWLEESGGTGIFYIGEESKIREYLNIADKGHDE